MTSNRNRKSTASLLAITSLVILQLTHSNWVAAQQSATTKPAIDIFSFRHPDTGEMIQFQYQPSSPETLRKYRPSQVRKMISSNFPARPSVRGTVKEFALDFPAEFVAFSGALLLSSSIHTNNDPASMKHFIDQNILDPAAYASFAGFLVGSRASHAALRAMGMAYDPYRNAPDYRLETPMRPGEINGLKLDSSTGRLEFSRGPERPDFLNTRAVKVPGAPTRAQLRFSPIVGPIGLGVGMTFSNVIHEVIADQDIRTCSKARSNPSVSREEADEACDKAWENWALSKKAADYTPDILAMGSAALIQAYLVNKSIGFGLNKAGEKLSQSMATISKKTVITGTEKIIPFVFRGYRLVTIAGTQHPIGRFAVTVANIAIFMEIVHPITPWFKKPFESVRQGANLANEISSLKQELDRAEKNSWQWKQQVVYWCEPTANLRDPRIRELRLNFGCPESKNLSPSVLLKRHAERHAKWRETLLQEAFQAHSNWQDHVGKFATMYANATNFYEQLVQHLNYQRFDKRSRSVSSGLFQTSPFFGISADGADFSNGSKLKAIESARLWLESYLARGKQFRATERSALPVILLGLQAVDSKTDIRKLAPANLGISSYMNLTETQRMELEWRFRESLLEKAMKQLREVLEHDPVFMDSNVSFGSSTYLSLSEGNPFMKLRVLLGNPEPLAEGLAFIRGSNDDANIIEQESKMNHPHGIGRAATNSMTDYLLTSMVCGPEVDPQFSDVEKIQIYNNKMKIPHFELALRELGLGTPAQAATDPGVLIAVEEFKRSLTGMESGSIPRWSKNAIAGDWTNFGLTFRPPRIVEGVPQDLCEKFPNRHLRNSSTFNIHKSQWIIGNETFNGILDIVKKKARSSIIGFSAPPSDKAVAWEDPFDTWWTKNVDSHVDRIVLDLRKRYKNIVSAVYLPALLGKQEGFLAKNLRDLNMPLGFLGWDVKLGALDSLYSELDLYLSVLARTTKNSPQMLKSSKSLKQEIREMGALVSNLDFVDQNGSKANAAVEARRIAMAEQIQSLKDAVEDFEKSNPTDTEIKAVNAQALRNILGLTGELDSYWGIVRGIQLQGR